MNRDPRISPPHKHGSGYRCRIRTAAGWKAAATRDTEGEALAAAAEKLAELDAAAAGPPTAETAPSQDLDPPTRPAAHKVGAGTGMRIQGVYFESARQRWRCKVVIDGVQRSAPMAGTEAEALLLAEQMLADAARQGARTIQSAINALVEHKRWNGAAASTLAGTERGLEMFWAGMLDSPVSRVSERTAQAQYLKLRETPAEGTGKLLSVDTQRCYLKHAKMFARWCVKQGWLRGPSPCDAVEAVGKRRYGKPQLSRRELLQLIGKCLELAGQDDLGAAAVLVAVCTGLRASEVLSREVKDLDLEPDADTGEDVPVLRVCDRAERAFKLKTGDSARSVQIHPLLQPVLDRLAADKAPADPLFPGTHAGRRRRQWLWTQVGRITRLAGVSVVCAHALRGSLATGAAASGVRVDLISAVLGHSDSNITKQHYIQRGTLERAQLERAQAALLRPQPASFAS